MSRIRSFAEWKAAAAERLRAALEMDPDPDIERLLWRLNRVDIHSLRFWLEKTIWTLWERPELRRAFRGVLPTPDEILTWPGEMPYWKDRPEVVG